MAWTSRVRELGISETIKRCSIVEWIDAFLAGLSSHSYGTRMAAESYTYCLTHMLLFHAFVSLP